MDSLIRKGFPLLLVSLAAALTGCGGGGETAEVPPREPGNASSPPSEPSKEFFVPGPTNVAATFGEEASAEEREEVSKGLEAFMAARAAGDWKTLCRYTSPREKAVLADLSQRRADLRGMKCPGIVEALAPPKAKRVNTMTGPVDSVRQEGGTRAFAFYHGARGMDYYMPMLIHYGDWEVAALAPTPIPKRAP